MLTLQNLCLLAVQTAIVTSIVTLLFLPAIFELKKPKDLGPRLIKENSANIRIGAFTTDIFNLDEEENNKSTLGLASCLCRFPNLEV
jgi:hypothetical protein